jgi:excisionase family DNA binding protein
VTVARAIIDELEPDDLAELARRLEPFLPARAAPAAATSPIAYTTTTLAGELGVSPRTIRAAIERGELDAHRSGRGWIIGAEAVAEWARGAPAPRGPRRVTRRSSSTPARPSTPMRDALAVDTRA